MRIPTLLSGLVGLAACTSGLDGGGAGGGKADDLHSGPGYLGLPYVRPLGDPVELREAGIYPGITRVDESDLREGRVRLRTTEFRYTLPTLTRALLSAASRDEDEVPYGIQVATAFPDDLPGEARGGDAYTDWEYLAHEEEAGWFFESLELYDDGDDVIAEGTLMWIKDAWLGASHTIERKPFSTRLDRHRSLVQIMPVPMWDTFDWNGVEPYLSNLTIELR